MASATAIVKGAAKHSVDRPAWIIHTSGTGILTWEDARAKTAGVLRPKEYNDWDGVEELTSLPDDAMHRNVDKIVLGAASDAVKVAIVCPPCINGPGRGSGNVRSMQAYMVATAAIKLGKGFLIGEGKNVWHHIHVQDLSELYLALGDAAAAGGGKATWGAKEGYYLAENGSFVWGDVQKKIAEVAHQKGFISTADVDVFSFKEAADKIHPFAPIAVGSNSRGHAIRARKLLGWNPKKPGLFELIPDIVDVQAQELGVAQKE